MLFCFQSEEGRAGVCCCFVFRVRRAGPGFDVVLFSACGGPVPGFDVVLFSECGVLDPGLMLFCFQSAEGRVGFDVLFSE